ncbi:hypothetical protein DC498_00565 [Terrimonas sp.]|uniref:hypothetical protein n=1 Tax=Terrimonas sp. TaxID=1914338 RepID=UPI000D509627|nr:hypothetical protein [Terrimonas sp.]PVD53923.1 hypothetical protein DC498_00565 [Terrimonas sp.]
MTIAEFKRQSNEEQADTLRRYGVFLAERICWHSRIYLYALSSVYIELFHDLDELEYSPIRILRVFEDPSELDAYLDEIDISGLILAS